MKTQQKIVLALLDGFTEVPTKTQLVKLLFLLGQLTEIRKQIPFYDFLPYRFGPFSFALYQDLEALQRYGLLYPNSLRITYGQKQKVRSQINTLPNEIRQSIDKILLEYGNLSLDTLVKKVYVSYPWYASRSERKPRSVRQFIEPAIYTVGYEGKSIDAFLDKLLSTGIVRLIDVRSNPTSRKYGFSKTTLCGLANKVEIEYVHRPELGVPSKDRKSLVTPEDYRSLFEMYENEILRQQTRTLQDTATMLREKPSALMCFERDARFCHRGSLARQLVRMTNLPSIHL